MTLLSDMDPRYVRAKSACHAAVFALRVYHGLRENMLAVTLSPDIGFLLGAGAKTPTFTLFGSTDRDNFENESHNVVLFALSAVAIALDAALFKKYGPRPLKPVNEAESIRYVVYKIRCAFAHDIMDPCWDVRGKLLVVTACGQTYDFAALKGTRVETAHLGNIDGAARLVEAALNLLK